MFNSIYLPFSITFVKHPVMPLYALCVAQAGEETGSLVKSTCATFLKTLEECMQIAGRTFSPDLQNLSPPPVAAIKPHKVSILWFPHTLGKELFIPVFSWPMNGLEFFNFSVLHAPQPMLFLHFALFNYVLCEIKHNHIANKPEVSISLWFGLCTWTSRCEKGNVCHGSGLKLPFNN